MSRVISEITSSYISGTPISVYSQPHANLLLSHMCINVLALFQHHNLFCCFVTNGLFCWFVQLCCVTYFNFKWVQLISDVFLAVSVYSCYFASTTDYLKIKGYNIVSMTQATNLKVKDCFCKPFEKKNLRIFWSCLWISFCKYNNLT